MRSRAEVERSATNDCGPMPDDARRRDWYPKERVDCAELLALKKGATAAIAARARLGSAVVMLRPAVSDCAIGGKMTRALPSSRAC